MKIAVSACLLGEPCRFDGLSKPCEWVCALQTSYELISVCPEVAGGLSTPRTPCEIVGTERVARVIDQEDADRTEAFMAGAQAAVNAAKAEGCQLAILKAKSPSCGSGLIYDGTFTNTLVVGYGVAAKRFRDEGIRVIDEVLLQKMLVASAHKHPRSTPALFATTSSQCPVLETERLVLRAITPDDAQDVFAYCSDPDIGADADWPRHRSIDDSRFFIDHIACAPHNFGIFEKLTPEEEGFAKTGPCIGSVGLVPDPHRKNTDCLMLGYALGKSAWGKGYMTEATKAVIAYGFEQLGLSLITSNHFTFNNRSRRVIEKCGFAYEGVLHAAATTPDGIAQDLMMYTLKPSEN